MDSFDNMLLSAGVSNANIPPRQIPAQRGPALFMRSAFAVKKVVIQHHQKVPIEKKSMAPTALISVGSEENGSFERSINSSTTTAPTATTKADAAANRVAKTRAAIRLLDVLESGSGSETLADGAVYGLRVTCAA